MISKSKPYKVTSVCKDDLLSYYYNLDLHRHSSEDDKALQKVLDVIDSLTDEQMIRLASKMEDDYVNQMFWQSMSDIFEDLYLEEKDNGITS